MYGFLAGFKEIDQGEGKHSIFDQGFSNDKTRDQTTARDLTQRFLLDLQRLNPLQAMHGLRNVFKLPRSKSLKF